MDDQTRAAQAAVPNQAAAEAQQTNYEQKSASGGSAMLDAQKQAGEMRQDDPVDHPSASNIAGDTEINDPTDTKLFTTTGNYPVDANELQKDYTPPPITSEQDAPNPDMGPDRPM
ncbi:hypothetical protein BV372_12860 [Nostoc sp. T09]|uniref:hypothetical protein n=1 Tax=Nostoc sp. T09 TaxID=1932621 RepID=UPI000A37D450|nr:hypothetical protein [Nostoc sp. T09]OUL34860.1 hypothetical protein BV372_12860 [Nostoc sp. T09]